MRELEKHEQVERSINKKFRNQIWSPFIAAVKRYQLISAGDKIAVCISGGKDSMLMAKLFQELQRHRKVSFELLFLVMDPGYNSDNRRLLEYNAKTLGIPITVFESTIFDVVDTVEKNPCYLCARMRRGYLYSKAQELGCSKIALGHHYDDVIETILMGMLHGGQIQDHDTETAQHPFRGHGTDPADVSCPGGGHLQVAGLERAAFSAVRLPFYRYLHHLPRRRHHILQAS